MGAPAVDLTIIKGNTFEFAYRYAEPALVYREISAMPAKTPVRLTSESHGIPDGWPVRIESVKTPAELNSPPDGCDAYIATVIDENTVELNGVNAADWRAYQSGGFIVFRKPFDLTGYAARMQVRDRVGGVLLLNLSSDSAAERDGTITLDTSLAAIIIALDAATTAAIPWQNAVYDLEIESPTGEVYPITGVSRISALPEVTQ
ncbi:hypothetical protein [Pseudomonas typographi]|uniref:hypothetical protein n=1 Tax=Pseudomonas typographi TaxID=2715964 RepID=UPI001687810A|nr:hypothetical protein [Pseudomonas typographi]MBD1554758.1 hypothetical protein [Pseudomonas typographi]